MPIDPNEIEEWKALAAALDLDRDRVAPALLSGRNPDADPKAIARRAGLLLLAVPALLSEREEMLRVLRKVEWRSPGGDGVGFCPACDRARPARDAFGVLVGGHAPDCRIDALLPKTA